MNKKIFRSAFYALGAVALLGGFTACSDDKVDSTTLNVDKNLSQNGITSEIDGACKTFDVSSNSDWTLSIIDADSTWIGVSDSVGHGNKTVAVYIDPMFGSSRGRTAKLRLRSGNVEQVINVEQTPTYNGETVANDDENTQALMIASTKGLGFGYSLNGRKLQTVLNAGALKLLMDNGNGMYDYLNTGDVYGSLQTTGASVDSVERKKDTLGVSIYMDLSYAAFKLHIGGRYHGNESKANLHEAYNYASKFNVASSTLQMPDILSIYNDAKTSTDDDDNTLKYKKGLMSPGFFSLIKSIENLYAKNDTVKAHAALNKLVSSYGIGVITEAELGAKIEVQLKFDLDSIAESMGIDSAKLQAGLKTQVSQFGLNGEATYQKYTEIAFNNSAYDYKIEGGSTKAAMDLDALLSSTRHDNDGLFERVQKQVGVWKNSINANDKKTLVNTHVGLCLIWNFLDDSCATDAQEYICKQYDAQIKKLFPDGIYGELNQ